MKKYYRSNKFVFAALLVVLFAVCFVVLCACKCQHEYTSEITKQPTCVLDGERTNTCTKCGDSFTETISKTGHQLVYKTTETQHWQECENCTYSTDKVAHTFDTVKSSVPSTCIQKGQEVRACACGKTETEIFDYIDCVLEWRSNDSNHWQGCKNCSLSYDDAREEHVYDGTEKVDVQPTCTTLGHAYYVCKVCGHLGEGHEKDEIPHQYTHLAYDELAHYYLCAMCGIEERDAEGELVPHIPHTYHVDILENATDTEPGTKKHSCIECNFSYTEPYYSFEDDLASAVNGQFFVLLDYLPNCYKQKH